MYYNVIIVDVKACAPMNMATSLSRHSSLIEAEDLLICAMNIGALFKDVERFHKLNCGYAIQVEMNQIE